MPTARSLPASHAERGVQREGRAVDQRDLAVLEALDADLRALQVAEHADVAAGALARPRARVSRRRAWSASTPCEKLTRTTSTPARTMSASTFASSVAGPEGRDDLGPAQDEAHAARSLQDVDRRQLLALDELEERAAAGRNVGNAVLDAVLLDGRQRVAAARQRERLGARDGVGERAGALAELIEFEHAHRPVPEDGAGGGDQPRERFGRNRGRCPGSSHSRRRRPPA